MSVEIILAILFIHWFADFVLQTDWQAKNKSSNGIALLSHTLAYTAVWWIMATFYCVLNYVDINDGKTAFKFMVLFPAVTFICHTVTDYFTSRLNTKLWNSKEVHWFFVGVGFDQWLHYLQLFLTYKLLF